MDDIDIAIQNLSRKISQKNWAVTDPTINEYNQMLLSWRLVQLAISRKKLIQQCKWPLDPV